MQNDKGFFGSASAVTLARWLLVAVGLLALLPGNHLIPLIDRDEPRFARATEEMMLRGEWIVPYFNNEYRFDKPILIYWLMRLCYALFGINEFAARLPSVLFAVIYALIVFEMGRRWFSTQAGFFAGLGLLTCVQLLIHGRSAVADMPMVAMVALAQGALFELLHARDPVDARQARGWFWILYVALGLGFLAKGPVAWVVPLLTAIVYRWVFRRMPLPWKRLRLGMGLPVTLAMVAAWGIPALVKTRGQFWTVGMHSHVWERGLQTFQGHGAFFLYYVVIALLSFFPWSAYIGAATGAACKNWSERNAFLMAWLVSTYVLFSFYKTKLPHYVMPAYPAFFLLMGQALDRDTEIAPWARWWRNIVLGIGLLLGIGSLAFGSLVTLPPAFQPLRWVAMGGAVLMFALVIMAAEFPRRLSPAAIFGPLAAVVVAMTVIGAGLRAVSPAVQMLSLLDDMPADATFGFCGFKEPSLVFYGHTRWEPLDFEEAAAFLRGPGPRLLVCEEQERRIEDFVRPLFGKLPRGRDASEQLKSLPAEGYSVQMVEGLNIARASAVRLRVLYRP